ncbi:hypothetical protein [Phenylobacterium aquaticum]|uniref:hypothetical protein n=1 Tax=Phenylobacterium aquaticum TaxID=1763816 RepID=UPI001F5D0636|nr:hypothetical protein [Phenylobacterium aquaticum]MCI3135299.1 hypothetical protein [Phenylobacterium aquaticum]
MPRSPALAGALLLALAAPAQAARPHAAPPAGPPTAHGIYVAQDACPFEGCSFATYWRATARAALYAAPGTASARAWIAPGEEVRALSSEYWLTPVRGVVRAATGRFRKGETVWRLEPQGEGVATLWRRGELDWIDSDEAKAVAWDRLPKSAPPDVWWVRVRRANGAEGWLRDPTRSFECLDQFSGDEGCRPAPAP